MIKQVIVMRTKYPDGNGGLKKLRLGKMISQSCHACLAIFLAMMVIKPMTLIQLIVYKIFRLVPDIIVRELRCSKNSPLNKWLFNSFTKVVCYVESEEEIMELHHAANQENILNVVITDNGTTEFHGVRTVTCIGFEPCESNVIDKITGKLKLL